MAKPRIFVASTFYDLRAVRSDLHQFITQMGFDAVLSERGSIAFAQDRPLEESCYAEVARCDILVAIVGDKYGADSRLFQGSITHNELRRALDEGKQVYVFVLDDVEHAYRHFKHNDKSEAVKYTVDVRILRFMDEVYALPTTGIHQFRDSVGMVNILREQWAGLFQDLLSQRKQVQQEKELNRVRDIAATLQKTVEGLKQDRWGALAISHPAVVQTRRLLEISHRAYVLTKKEYDDWIMSLGFAAPSEVDDDGYIRYTSDTRTLKIRPDSIFTERGHLATPMANWREDAVLVERHASGGDFPDTDDDDIPF